MLQPVRTKWRKAHKGRIHGTASRANFINYGAYALKALTTYGIIGIKVWIYKGEVFAKEFSQETNKTIQNEVKK